LRDALDDDPRQLAEPRALIAEFGPGAAESSVSTPTQTAHAGMGSTVNQIISDRDTHIGDRPTSTGSYAVWSSQNTPTAADSADERLTVRGLRRPDALLSEA
jgi:hypothetical protein